MTTRRPDDKLDRRQFIRIAGIGLTAPVFLAHCSDDDPTTPGPGTPIEPGEQFFPQSVASGDPTADSIVLWTRLQDEGAELPASLVISRDEAQTDVVATQSLVATAEHDFVLKLRVSGLEAGATYYYRFVYDKAGTQYGSRVGRTKTAPAADADVPVRFAFASCQDFIGRYYNSYAKMLELADDLDFFVHLGDYIYETTGDPGFQSEGGERRVAFTDTEGAIAFTDAAGEITHYGARSLDNYRELYKTYRSDPFLQQVHEKLPMVSIWDDHEFSDDCWKDNATYFDGRTNEDAQTERRQNAERAHFEFMPLDRGLSPEGDGLAASIATPITDPAAVLYRDLRFGKHLHLVVTDTRTYRPDHPIREDAFYGRVILTEAELTAEGIDPQEVDGAGLPVYAPYVDIGAAAWSDHRAALVPILTDAYKAGGPGLSDEEAAALAETATTGNVAAVVVNELLADAITAGTLTAIDTDGLPRGMTIDHLRFQKKFLFANDGIHARYLVHQARYELWQKVAFAKDPSGQDVLGQAQETWLRDVLSNTDATWKVLGTSISFTSMIIDVSDAGFPPTLVGDPDEELIKEGTQTFQAFFDAPYLFSVDQWDGFPQKRAQLFDWMREIPNVVSIAGDIHSSYVADHGNGGKSHNIFELTGAGISSEPFKGFVREKVDAVVPGATQSPSISALIERLEDFLLAANPTMVHASNDTHGFVMVEVTGDAMTATFHYAEEEHVAVDTGGDAAAAAAPFQTHTFVISGDSVTAS
jgi:alkaline phosphatase D